MRVCRQERVLDGFHHRALPTVRRRDDVRSGRQMQVADGADAVESVLERCKGGGLREEHQETVEAFVEVGELLWLKKLQTQIWEGERRKLGQ
jgi:hypothetical protein